MKMDSNLFETFQRLRTQQQNRNVELFAKYENKIRQQEVLNRDEQARTSPNGGEPPMPSSKLTFRHISSNQLNQWLEKKSGTGNLSNDQVSGFKVLIYSATRGDSENGESPINFNERAQQAIQSAIKRKDTSAVAFWANALSAMKKFEGEHL